MKLLKIDELLKIEKIMPRRALLAHLLFLLVFIIFICWVFDFLKINDFFFIKISTLIVGVIVTIASYINYIKLPTFKKNEIGIIFSFNENNESVNDILDKIYNNLSIEFSKHRKINFKIKKIYGTRSPLNIEDAHDMIRKTDATLIFWGTINQGNESNNKITVLNPVHFTYAMYDPFFKDRVVEDPYLNSINWKIRKSDDYMDIKYLSKNISNFSRFIVALSLASHRHFIDSSNMIKKLIGDIRKSKDKNLEGRLKILHAFCMNMIINYYLNPKYKDKNNAEKILKLEHASEEMLNVNDRNAGAYLLRGIINFLKNKVEDAMKEIVLAKKYADGVDSAPYYSMSFLQFYDGKMEFGWTNLKDALKMEPYQYVNKIVEFYEDILREDSTKKMLNLPLGVIYFEELKEYDLARENITEFLKNFKLGNKIYEREIELKCKKILNKIQNL